MVWSGCRMSGCLDDSFSSLGILNTALFKAGLTQGGDCWERGALPTIVQILGFSWFVRQSCNGCRDSGWAIAATIAN